MPVIRPAFLALLLVFALRAENKTVWDGVYSPAQAGRGASVYAAECARCHKDDLTGYNNLLVNPRFLNDWREDKLQNFFDTVKMTMPRNAPGSLEDTEYLDIVAYVLKMNQFPAGSAELTMNTLPGIRVEGRNGPEAVPNFSLVEITGCLVQDAGGTWKIANATEPVRTRDPGESSAEELKSLEKRPAGSHMFRLLDVTIVRGAPPKNHQVEAKGFLIRKTGDDSINLSSLQPFGGACGN